MTNSNPYAVTVHLFASKTPFSCAYERGSTTSPNALVYVGGLTSGPHTTPQLELLVDTLRSSCELSYSFWEFRMRSSYTGFGFSSLASDAEDVAALVSYLRGLGKVKIVLLGSSTGCQDILTYAKFQSLTVPVDAYILQAPTSDRETASLLMPEDFLATTLKHAEDMITRGDQGEIMPKALVPPIFTSPITAYRWHSLIAKGGDDDFFSSDLDDTALKESFGRLEKPTLIMPSGNDEMVPGSVDKAALLQRWKDAAPAGVVSELSDINPEADHELTGDEMQKWFVERVMSFLRSFRE